MIKFGKAA